MEDANSTAPTAPEPSPRRPCRPRMLTLVIAVTLHFSLSSARSAWLARIGSSSFCTAASFRSEACITHTRTCCCFTAGGGPTEEAETDGFFRSDLAFRNSDAVWN